MLDWMLRNGIGGFRGHVAGEHVCQRLLGERDPAADYQPARRRRGVLWDQDRVVGQKHFIPAPELFWFGKVVQEACGILPWGQKRPYEVAPNWRLVYMCLNQYLQNNQWHSLHFAVNTWQQVQPMSLSSNSFHGLIKQVWVWEYGVLIITLIGQAIKIRSCICAVILSYQFWLHVAGHRFLSNVGPT